MTDDLTDTLLITRRRYLAHLELQRAQLGLSVPPHILIDIEQTSAEIGRLAAQAHRYVLRPEVLAAERPARMPGAILLISPERPDQRALEQAAFEAIDYHRAALQCCWLIASGGEHGAMGAALQLQRYCEDRGIRAFVWQIADPLSIHETYNLVDWLYTYDVPARGLAEAQVIADITGATKPMSFGMLLACRGRRPVQYMARQAQGPSLPLLLELATPEGPPSAPRQASGQ